jgi:hypothetical protein
LIGIASELGKLEQKLAKIGASAPPAVDLDPLVDLLNEVLRVLNLDVSVPGVNYYFRPPYDTPGVGLAQEYYVEIPEGGYGIAAIQRLDAIAEALGTMSKWRVKLSKGNAVRPNVTLTAY